MESLKKFIPWILLGILVLWGIGKYNGIVGRDQTVKKTWADVESDYQRRMDLIPNLVNTVKGYANFEQETLTKVTEARASATQIKVDPSNLTPEKLQEFQQAQSGVSSAIGRLLVVSENYPELKANQNFLDLQSQLEGTENRIAVARIRFNEAAGRYNATISRFPTNLFGLTPRTDYFKAEAEAIKAPRASF